MKYRYGIFLWMLIFVIFPLLTIQLYWTQASLWTIKTLFWLFAQVALAWFFSGRLERTFLFDQKTDDHLKSDQTLNYERCQPKCVNDLFILSESLERLIETYSSEWASSNADILLYKDRILTLEKSYQSLDEKIKTQETVNRMLSDKLTQPVVLLDESGIILEANPVFEERLGYNRGETTGKPLSHYTGDEDPLFSSGSPIAFKIGKLGQIEYITFHTQTLTTGNILCVGRFLNDDLMVQSQILRKNRELEYINQINSSLISNWSVDELLENIIKRIDYLFSIQAGIIHILSPEKEWRLKTFASKHLGKEEIEALHLERHFSEQWLSNPQIETVNFESSRVKSIVLAPLEVAGEVIAVMSIALIQPMSENDLNILRMFTNQASMVVQRALIYDQLRKQYLNTIEALVNVIEVKDKYTEGHSRRVSRFAVEIAKEMGYSKEEIEDIEIAGLLHDIGKIGIRQDILTKRGRLTNDEYAIMKQHPEKGYQILESINLKPQIKEAVLYHHLRYDLMGYPDGQTLDVLPTYAGIIGIADAFDAITSARSYSEARSIDSGLEEIKRFSGTQFVPQLVSVLEALIKNDRWRIKHIIDDDVFNLIAEGEFNVLSSFI
jgi:putative nucleotidyltransferase with HDIG domain